MVRPKGIVVPKYVKKLCSEMYEGQTDPLYSVASTGRVYGRSHAGDCVYNLRIDLPKFPEQDELFQKVIRYFDRIAYPNDYLATLKAVRDGTLVKTW